MDKSVREIADLVGGAVVGDGTVRITGINAIKHAKPGDLTFLGNKRYLPFLEATEASAILVTEDFPAWSKPIIRVQNPYVAFVRVIQSFGVPSDSIHPRGIHETAVLGANVQLGNDVALDAHVCIADDVVLGDGVVVYAGTYIGRGCTIGQNTLLYPNVTLREGVVVGARCILHAGVVIGADGFGFAPVNDMWFKIPQVGNVVIGDDVEIGSNSAVDRATFGSTLIGNGTKIDNLVQIGHNVELGEHCVVSGMTGIAGSTCIGDHTIIAAQVGISDHLEIGDHVTIGGRSCVVGSIAPGRVVWGFPAKDHIEEKRLMASLHRMPDLLKRARDLEQRVAQLESQGHGKTAHHSE